MVEALEDRLAPAQLVVMNAQDVGAGSLRNTIANASPNDTIVFAQSMTINLNTQIQLRQNGLTIAGQDPNGVPLNITISGQNMTRIFEVVSGFDTLNNLTFTAGNGTDGAGNAGNGGAILIDSAGGLTLNNDNFTTNRTTGAGTNGGAIENDNTLSIYGGTFVSNTSVNRGGAIENTVDLTVTASQGGASTTFSSNSAARSGGAIDSAGNGSGQLYISNSNFYGNSANFSGGAIDTNDPTALTGDIFGQAGQPNTANGGGAIYARAGTALPITQAQLVVTNSMFDSNQATLDTGGAIYTSAWTDVETSTFTNNKAPDYGGAIDSNIVNQNDPPTPYYSTLTINLSTFLGNSSQDGGAVASLVTNNSGSVQTIITNDTFAGTNKVVGRFAAGLGLGGAVYIFESTSGSTGYAAATLTNDTFFQNTSDGHGGALALALSDSMGRANRSTAVLTSLTVNQNTAATDSGGLYVDSALTGVVSVRNSILSGNTVTAPGYNGPVDVTLTNNRALNDVGFNLVGTSNNMLFNVANHDILNDNPGLANGLAANGAPPGYPQTLALLASSPGYQEGDQTLAGQSGALGIDERGFTRESDGVLVFVSIGAEDPDATYSGGSASSRRRH